MTASLDLTSLDALLALDPLVVGEERCAYEALRQHMLDDLRPEGAFEAIWAEDIVDLTWQRRQCTRQRALIIAQSEYSVLWLRLRGHLHPTSPAGRRLAALLRRFERRDPKAVADIARRLAQRDDSIASVAVQARSAARSELDQLETSAAALERRRERLLREVERHQAFAARVRAIAQQYERRTAAPGEDERIGRPPSAAEIARGLREGRH